ncbi:MAG: ribosomal protein L7/L12 [Thermoguttaceae bacterium]|nr:ribosomal protein L7/L12 [Thermoguttaceae bacterium]
MSDKVIKCNSCGFPLDASSASHNRIKCPKCGSVNVIEPAKSPSDSDNESVSGGFPLTAGGAAIHKGIVAWIIANYETAPTDVFEHLRLTGVERLYLPCYLFECYSSIHYSYQIGNKRERVRKISESNDYLETYTEYSHQNDDYDFSDVVLVSGCSQYSDKIQALYNGAINVANLTDVDNLKRASDVKELSFDVSFSSAQAEAKTIVGKRSQEQIVSLLKRSDYKDLHVRDDYRVEYASAPKRILAPLIHVTFAYKDQLGDLWLTGDAERVIEDHFPKSYSYRKSHSESNAKPADGGCSGCLWCLLVLFGLYLAGAGIVSFFDKSAPTGAPFLLLLLGGLVVWLGGYLIVRTDLKNQKIRAEQERLLRERAEVFRQFLKKQVPLNGVLQKGLRGNPEAFPDDVQTSRHKEFDSNEPKAVLAVQSIGNNKMRVAIVVRNATSLSLEEAKALVESQPSFTISVPESLASFVQSRLEKAGATVTRQS